MASNRVLAKSINMPFLQSNKNLFMYLFWLSSPSFCCWIMCPVCMPIRRGSLRRWRCS